MLTTILPKMSRTAVSTIANWLPFFPSAVLTSSEEKRRDIWPDKSSKSDFLRAGSMAPVDLISSARLRKLVSSDSTVATAGTP